MNYRVGDVIEFFDCWLDGDKWHKDPKEKYVGRIDTIYWNQYPLEPGEHEFELWLEYFSEMPSRTYVPLEYVIRVIEEGRKRFYSQTPPLKHGTKVIFDEGEKKLFDEIIGFQMRWDDKATFEYKMKHSGYMMSMKDFVVLKGVK